MCFFEMTRVDVAGNTFEQHVGRVAQDAHDADDDDRRNEEREQRIDPRTMRQCDRDAAEDDRGAPKRIAEDVKERGAHVEVALAARPQQQADSAVDRKPDGRQRAS